MAQANAGEQIVVTSIEVITPLAAKLTVNAAALRAGISAYEEFPDYYPLPADETADNFPSIAAFDPEIDEYGWKRLMHLAEKALLSFVGDTGIDRNQYQQAAIWFALPQSDSVVQDIGIQEHFLSCSASKTEQISKFDGDGKMLIDNVLIDKAWEQYIRIFGALHAEISKNNLESYYDGIDQWEQNSSEISSEVVDPLISILNDEIRRKKTQLGNKPGRQPATDWLKSLESHLLRLEDELLVMGYFEQQAEDRAPQALLELILESLAFSVELVKADQSQITSRVEVGDFILSQQQQALMQRASDSLDKALIQ